MKATKSIFSSLIFACAALAAESSHAASTLYTIQGNITSLSATIAGMPSLTSVFDTGSTDISGKLVFNAGNGIGPIMSFGSPISAGLSVNEAYHSVNFTAAGGLNAQQTYPESRSYLGGFDTVSYDAATRTVHFSDGLFFSMANYSSPYCVGSSAICSKLWDKGIPENGFSDVRVNGGDFDMLITFSADFRSFEGTASFSRPATGGAIWSGTYEFTGTFVQQNPVPLPAAGWLLGSGLIGLAGITKRRARA